MISTTKEQTPPAPSAALLGRVEIPKSAFPFFSQAEVHITLENAAKVLGFATAEELKVETETPLRLLDGQEALSPVLSAAAFNKLVVLCAAKTTMARQLLEELSSTWRQPRTGAETVTVPAEPLPSVGTIPRWPSAAPEAVGMDRAPLERLRQYLQWRTRMKHWAGITCGICRNGQLVYFQECGFQDAENKVRMTADSYCRLFSMTKCLVAAAFMTYVEDPSYTVELDDPVSKFIPAWSEKKMTVLPKRGQKDNQPLDKPITLRQLITHTSGLGYGATLDDPWPPEKGSYYKIYETLCNQTATGQIITLEQWVNALAKVPLKGQPGHFWDYSYGVDVLGRVLEIIAGKTLDKVVEERICGPLKMRDTSFRVPPGQAHRLGPWYKSIEIEGKPNIAHRLQIVDYGGERSGWFGSNVSPVLSAGGTVEVPLVMKGGMVSTFNDYLRFLLMLRNFGELDGVRVLRRETVQYMICNHVPVACTGKRNVFVFDKPGLGYNCLGSIQALHPKQDKGTFPGEYGWGGLAGPAWTIDPRSDIIILAMTQTAFVLDHEEYLRYTARKAIAQFSFGGSYSTVKATAAPPESFDAAKLRPIPELASDEAALDNDKDFEEEFLVQTKTRVRRAKELAICPGPRLDRHPSDEEARENAEDKAVKEETDPLPTGKKRRSNAGEAPTEKKNGSSGTVSPRRNSRALSPQKTPPGSSPIPSVASEPSEGLLFSRVCLKTDEEVLKKARVTAVKGDAVEVITEKEWRSHLVSRNDVAIIDESQIGTPVSKLSGPSDFSFLKAVKSEAPAANGSSKRGGPP